jgi:hypothetical protein
MTNFKFSKHVFVHHNQFPTFFIFVQLKYTELQVVFRTLVDFIIPRFLFEAFKFHFPLFSFQK